MVFGFLAQISLQFIQSSVSFIQLISAKNMFKCSPLVDAVAAGDGGGGVGPRWKTENLLRPGQLVTHLPYSSLPLSHLIPGQLVSHLVHLFHNWYFRDNLLPISPFPIFHLLQVFTHLPFSSLPLSQLILQSPFPHLLFWTSSHPDIGCFSWMLSLCRAEYVQMSVGKHLWFSCQETPKDFQGDPEWLDITLSHCNTNL